VLIMMKWMRYSWSPI